MKLILAHLTTKLQYKCTKTILVPSNIVTRSLKNTDTDDKNNTEVSVFQYVFEIRSISISI